MLSRSLHFEPAETLGTVGPEAFTALDDFARKYQVAPGLPGRPTSELAFNIRFNGDTTVFPSYTRLIPYENVFTADEAREAVRPFLEAADEWLLKDARTIYFDYARSLVPPDTSQRMGGTLHFDDPRSRVVRNALFFDVLPTDIAVGTLKGKMRRRFERVSADLPAEGPNVPQDRLLELFRSQGVLEIVPASRPLEGAGIHERTIHGSRRNDSGKLITRNFLRISTVVA